MDLLFKNLNFNTGRHLKKKGSLCIIVLCKLVNKLWLWHLLDFHLPGWSGAVGTTVSVGLDRDGIVVKDEVSVWLEMVAAGIVGRKLVTSSTWDSRITVLSWEPGEWVKRARYLLLLTPLFLILALENILVLMQKNTKPIKNTSGWCSVHLALVV